MNFYKFTKNCISIALFILKLFIIYILDGEGLTVIFII